MKHLKSFNQLNELHSDTYGSAASKSEYPSNRYRDFRNMQNFRKWEESGRMFYVPKIGKKLYNKFLKKLNYDYENIRGFVDDAPDSSIIITKDRYDGLHIKVLEEGGYILDDNYKLLEPNSYGIGNKYPVIKLVNLEEDVAEWLYNEPYFSRFIDKDVITSWEKLLPWS
jgi:hypothetical protein